MSEDASSFDAWEIREGIRRRRFSAREVVARCLAQIEALEPAVSAFREVLGDEALAAAADVDRRLEAGEDAGALAGVPFSVKANMCTRTGTSDAGSRMLEAYRAPYDATVVERMRAAGAILVGKTNMDEFAMGSSTENSAWGPTRNPWKLDHVPGGSSGGAAAAAAAVGLVHLGSDTGGSIRQPASFCGVTGLKPSYGRVSRYGLIAFASSLDQIGPLARTAREAALVLGVIAGRDPMDSTSVSAAVPDYLAVPGAAGAAGALAGVRLGVPREYFVDAIEPDVRARVEEAIDTLRGLGAEVREVSLPHTRYANPTYVIVSAAEASSNLSRYDGMHYGARSDSSRDLLETYAHSRGEAFGDEVKRRIMVGTFVLSSGYYDAFYRKAMKVRRLIRADFEAAFREVDALICPTSPVPAFPLAALLDDPLKLYAVDILTVSSNLAAVPAISFPCGFTPAGLPVGAQVIGRHLEEGMVLRVAHAFQGATQYHRARPALEGVV